MPSQMKTAGLNAATLAVFRVALICLGLAAAGMVPQALASGEPKRQFCETDGHCPTGHMCTWYGTDFKQKRCMRKSDNAIVNPGSSCASSNDCPRDFKCDRRRTSDPWRCVKAR